jgi:hypothetical protein
MNIEDLDNLNSAEAVESLDFKKIFKDAYINPSEKIIQQPIALSIGEKKYKGVFYPVPFGSYGDFSCLVGASKSGKTFLKSSLEAAYLGGASWNYFESIKAHDNMDKVVVAFDTEQSRYHVQRVTQRVLEMVGNDDGRYNTFALRRYNAKERLQFIDWVVYESDFRGHIGLMSIDGYADLLDDFNNLEESTRLTQKLLEWTANAKMHCTGILHKNFGSEKPVGHFGSSVLKKSETSAFIEDENGEKTVECRYSRNIPFDNFKYAIDENTALPYQVSIGDTMCKSKAVVNYEDIVKNNKGY